MERLYQVGVGHQDAECPEKDVYRLHRSAILSGFWDNNSISSQSSSLRADAQSTYLPWVSETVPHGELAEARLWKCHRMGGGKQHGPSEIASIVARSAGESAIG
jgi:hypothetical protein